MQTGTQLYASEGFETLRKGATYHLLRSDPSRQRVLLLEFHPNPTTAENASDQSTVSNCDASKTYKLQKNQYQRPSFEFKPVLHYLSRHSFEQAVDDGTIAPRKKQEELPPWLANCSIDELRAYSANSTGRKRSHDQRIDNTLLQSGPSTSRRNPRRRNKCACASLSP